MKITEKNFEEFIKEIVRFDKGIYNEDVLQNIYDLYISSEIPLLSSEFNDIVENLNFMSNIINLNETKLSNKNLMNIYYKLNDEIYDIAGNLIDIESVKLKIKNDYIRNYEFPKTIYEYDEVKEEILEYKIKNKYNNINDVYENIAYYDADFNKIVYADYELGVIREYLTDKILYKINLEDEADSINEFFIE